MSIAIEQPPASLPSEVQEYLNRVLIQVSGAFENLEKEVADLKKQVDGLTP